MNFNVNQLVRSTVILVVGLPVSLGVLVASLPEEGINIEKTDAQVIKDKLSVPCLKYAFTKDDSKGERLAKDAIDAAFGDGVDYNAVCKWVLS